MPYLTTKSKWILADIVSRKILESSESFEALCLTAISKYGADDVSFDKVAGRDDVRGFLRSLEIPHVEDSNTAGERFVSY